jgi:hypothetical protein
MTASIGGHGQHDSLATADNGKTPSSEDFDEKFLGSNHEFAQGNAVSRFKFSRHHF